MTKRNSMLKKSRPITDAEHQKILGEVKCSEFRSFLDLLFHTGARQTDIANPSAEDVHQAGDCLKFRSSKSRLLVHIPLDGCGGKILVDAACFGPLFPSLFGKSLSEISGMFSKFRQMAGLESTATLHSYRLRILEKMLSSI